MVTILSFTRSLQSYCSGHIPNVCQMLKKSTYITLSLHKKVSCLDPRSATEICVTDATMLFDVYGFFGS